MLAPLLTWDVLTAGWLLFMIFCGAGLVALPLDMIREFLGRPKTTIPKSEYMTRAKALGNKAKGIMVRPSLLYTLCLQSHMPVEAHCPGCQTSMKLTEAVCIITAVSARVSHSWRLYPAILRLLPSPNLSRGTASIANHVILVALIPDILQDSSGPA